MPARTDLTITSFNHNDGNKKVTNKISYVNPNITNQQAVTLANMFVDLTKDNYSNTTRTDTTDCDTALTRPVTSIKARYTDGGNFYHEIPNNGVIDITTDQIADKQLMLTVQTPFDGMCPIVENLTDNDTESPINIVQVSWAFMSTSSDQLNRWVVVLATAASSSQRLDITARTVSFNLHFKQSMEYGDFTKNITFNITDPQQP